MNNAPAILRVLIFYAFCCLLAIVVGYTAVLLVNSSDYSDFGVLGVLALVLSAPILLRWHHPLLVLCWNLPLIAFFLPGRPTVFLPMLAVSLGISLLQRAMDRKKRFIPAPQITLPLLCLLAVEVVTANMMGGIGLHALGSPVMGGRKYIILLAGILGFFALTARRIPPRHAVLYVGMFLLGGGVSIIGDLVAFIPSSFYFIFLIFPFDSYALGNSSGTLRFTGASALSSMIFSFMLARYGVHGIFRAGKPWRLVVFILFTVLGLFGGFRSLLMYCALLFMIQFYLEGLHRTRLLPVLAFAALLAALVCLPMASRLPYTFQRALSFLPVNIDSAVQADAQASLQWRFDMWKALLPQVSDHLLLGKGYAITQDEYQMMGRDSSFRSVDPAEQALALSSDYHSGPLSVILSFGIWGAIAFLWFLTAGVWALHHNRLYGDPALRGINNFLFAMFLTKVIVFFFIFGALSDDIVVMTGLLGLSVSLNGGICRPDKKPATTTADAPAHNTLTSSCSPSLEPSISPVRTSDGRPRLSFFN